MGQPDEDEFTPDESLPPGERNLETPERDAVEQAIPVDPSTEEPVVQRGFEVDDWDSLEQARIVGVDEDDYR
ncbi:hypothetical protein ACK8GG_00625 [Micromonosporaceae bacterium DT55]|uniref:hypothetical protein n=1 Tax=Melissospora conviva TaxID=3388432 RepID=UPI003C1F9276